MIVSRNHLSLLVPKGVTHYRLEGRYIIIPVSTVGTEESFRPFAAVPNLVAAPEGADTSPRAEEELS